MNEYLLQYDKPAKQWREAFLLGNGRLGMTVYGDTEHERLNLNEESLWSGYPADQNEPDCATHLSEMRRLIFAGEIERAEQLCAQYQRCRGKGSCGTGRGEPYGSFRSAGTLHIDVVGGLPERPGEGSYLRQLDLRSGVVTVSDPARRAQRTHFVSAGSDLCCSRLITGCPTDYLLSCACPDAQISVQGLGDGGTTGHMPHQSPRLVISGAFEGPGALHYCTVIGVYTDGCVTEDERGLLVRGARRLTLYSAGSTDYSLIDRVSRADGSWHIEPLAHLRDEAVSGGLSYRDEAIDEALFASCVRRIVWGAEEGFDALLERHIAYMQELTDRAVVSFAPADERRRTMTTDARLEAVRRGEDDPGLLELYYNFGRYLLISAAPGRLPANLQGLWEEGVTPPWSADYHININIQMNYWNAEATGLGDLVMPFFSYLRMLARPENGQKTAREMYGCRGWVAHTITTPFGYTAPGEHPSWGAFIGAGPWCCRHITEHWLYTRDRAFLAEYYPIMRESARFLLDFLCTDPGSGYLVTCPTNSPENHYRDPKTGKSVAMCAGATMDNSIARELLLSVADAADTLGCDPELAAEAREAAGKLPPLRIGRHGQIMEWMEDYEEVEPGHRHISNLYGLYPGFEIGENTPALYEAARVTLRRRLENATPAGEVEGAPRGWGCGNTGWSCGWLVNFFARLHDGEGAYRNLQHLLRHNTFPNLADTHPWGSDAIFQIDGNLGAPAGITEMLLQSQDGVELLPALPDAWQEGFFRGLRARGGFAVDCAWKDGRIVSLRVQALCDGELRLRSRRFPDGAREIVRQMRCGETFSLEF